MLTEVYSAEVVGGFLSSDRLFFILLLAHALKNLLPISKLIAFLPTKFREEPILQRPGNIGQLLVQMLDGCQHRGPDSTGFAMYHESNGEGLICRIYLGCRGDSPTAHALEKKVLATIAEHGG